MADAKGRITRDEWRRRVAALRTLAEDTNADPGSPAWEEALRAFGSERELVLAVHQRWQTHLLARLDQVLENGADDPHREVIRAVEELSRTLPGLAAVLAAHADDPALDRARQRLAHYVDQACPCGRPHPLVAARAPRRSRSRCVVVRRIRAMAAEWRRSLDAPPDAAPPGVRLAPRAV